jgi:hypothetical protein
MNERIKELWDKAAQAAAAYPSGQNNSWETQVNFMEKFAELIVRECIAKAEEESERYLTWNTEDCNRFSKVMQNYKELLKEHFGVEE